jgi:hypothetical protein
VYCDPVVPEMVNPADVIVPPARFSEVLAVGAAIPATVIVPVVPATIRPKLILALPAAEMVMALTSSPVAVPVAVVCAFTPAPNPIRMVESKRSFIEVFMTSFFLFDNAIYNTPASKKCTNRTYSLYLAHLLINKRIQWVECVPYFGVSAILWSM